MFALVQTLYNSNSLTNKLFRLKTVVDFNSSLHRVYRDVFIVSCVSFLNKLQFAIRSYIDYAVTVEN